MESAFSHILIQPTVFVFFICNSSAKENSAYSLIVDSGSFLVYRHLTSLGACMYALVMKIDGSKVYTW